MKPLAQLPNVLTVSRLFLALYFLNAPDKLWIPLISIALATEILDGPLARRFGWTSLAGQLLDPFADRLLVLCVGARLLLENIMAPGELALLLTRDVVVTAGFLAIVGWFKRGDLVSSFKPNGWGKLTTGLQYFTFYAFILSKTPSHWSLWATAAAGLMACFHYFKSFLAAHGEDLPFKASMAPGQLEEKRENGRIRLVPLALLILGVGLWMDQWWWQIGLYILITLFVLAFLRYRRSPS